MQQGRTDDAAGAESIPGVMNWRDLARRCDRIIEAVDGRIQP